MSNNCEICEYTSNRISNVIRHEISKHEYYREELKSCSHCNLTFRTSREYKSHCNKYHLSAEQINILKLKAAGYRKKYKDSLKSTEFSTHSN